MTKISSLNKSEALFCPKKATIRAHLVSLSAVVARKLKDKRILSRYGGLPASLPLTFRNPDTNFMACIVLLKSCLTPLERTEVHGA